MSVDTPREALAVIRERAPNFAPALGLVLGSGMGSIAEEMTDAITISYKDLPGFPGCTIEGHAGCLRVGKLFGLPIFCYQGRGHSYEGANASAVKTMIRTLRLAGAHIYLGTNAAGSLRTEVGPGSLVSVSDHINFHITNPLVGPNDGDYGSRFVAMDNAYDPELRAQLRLTAERLGILLPEGVYVATMGPIFETPAEIRAYRILGADVVGMSTVPEVIVARHAGLRVAVLSIVTNLAAGMSEESITHDGTIHYAQLAKGNLTELLRAFFKELAL